MYAWDKQIFTELSNRHNLLYIIQDLQFNIGSVINKETNY